MAGNTATVNVLAGGSINAVSTAPAPVMQLGTGGTGVLAVFGTGRITGFGLNIGAGGTLDLSGGTDPAGIVLNSLTGTGTINVGTSVLAVSNAEATSFGGRIRLEGASNTNPHGIFAKAGEGTLTIDGATIGKVDAGSTQEGEFVVLRGAIAQTSGDTKLSSVVIGLQTSGAMNVSGGTLAIDTGLTVGSFGGTGTVTQTGGAVTINQGCGAPARCASLNIGNQGGNGTYTISNGSLTFNGPGFVVLGRNPTATAPAAGLLQIDGGQVSVNQGTAILGNNAAPTGQGGTGTITQTGGTLTIANAAELYLAGSGTGTYNLNGGTLQIGGTSLKRDYAGLGGAYQFNLGGGTIQVLGTALTTDVNATLVGTTTSTIDTNGLGAQWSGILSGTGSLTKTGAGTLTLGAANTYSGTTTVSEGTLALGSSARLGLSSSLVVGAAGTFDMSAVTSPAPAVVLNGLSGAGLVNVGTNALVVVDGSPQQFSGRMSLEGNGWDASHGTFVMAGPSTLTIDNARIGRASGSGGSGEMIVGGGGALAQTSGDTKISALVLGLGDVAAGSANVGALNVTGGNLTLDTSLTVGSFGGTGTVTQSAGNVAVNYCGDITHCAALSIGNQGGKGAYNISGGTLAFNGPGQMVLGRNEGATTTASTGELLISGTGQVIVSNADLIVGNHLSTAAAQGTGTISQTGGTLTINNNANLNLGGSGHGIYNLSGGTLQIGGSSLRHDFEGQTAGGYKFNLGGGTIQVLGSALTTDIVAELVTGTSTIDTNGLEANWSGVLSGAGSLRKAGAGTLFLTASNDYTGGTAIDGGVLAVTSDANLGAPSGALRFGGGTLRLDADFTTARAITTEGTGSGIDTNGHALTLSQSISGGGSFAKLGAGNLVLTGDSTYTGGTTISGGTLQLGDGGTTGSIVGDVTNNTALIFNRSNAMTFAGAISGSGTVTKLGADALTLTGASSYSGGTILKFGRINVGHSTALGTGTLAMDEGTTLGFASDGLNLANAVVLTGTSDPVIDTGAFTGTLSGVISGGGALTKDGSGTLVLAGANTYTGATAVNAGTLRAGAANALSAASAHTVAPGATLDTGGFDQRLATLTNNGTVSLAGASAASALTVTGAYVGNGATLRLGTGGAGVGNRLVVDGPAASASGTTTVQIANLDGLGALTSGNGIEVIGARNGATTTAQTTRSAFALAGGHVDAGAFEYRLHAADARGAGESWYLRSTTTVVPPIDPIITPLPPIDPTNPSPPTVEVPTYRAEVPMLAALPGQVRQADLAMMGNLHRRMGDEAPGTWGAGAAPQDGSAFAAPGSRPAWGRLVYADLDIQAPGAAQARADTRVSGLQAGTDLFVANGWRAGIYVGFLDGKADVSGNARGVNAKVGSNDLRSRFLGAYGTWMDTSGWYVDTVLQGASHRLDIRPTGNATVSAKASGFMASVETGKAFALTETWSLEPQAQLAWQHNDFDDVVLSGARVRQDSSSGWIGRLGLRVKGDLATGAGRLQPYGRVNFYHGNFSGDTAVFIGPAAATAIDSKGSYSAGEVAAGATLALTATTSVYGEIGTLWNIGGDASVKSSVQGALGIKVRW
ncbi:autotransporter outer membrane beta-barrel domain-containing protein [Variovorax robiniae]|uniref:Autotransporter outer membrane beta-barrel domain-containing protein n=1 Tax=Variovorax robiniae TaxID=1836199 RepID=A0ABU8XCK3_9BURK